MMYYFKLMAINLIVALVIAISIVGFAVADGIDDPNFYKDYDSMPYKYHKSVAPPEYHAPVTPCLYSWEGCNEVKPQVATVPEPYLLLMTGVGLILTLVKFNDY